MPTPMVKSTYALDTETLAALEQVAKRWGVTKAEALRRAIRAAAQGYSRSDWRLWLSSSA